MAWGRGYQGYTDVKQQLQKVIDLELGAVAAYYLKFLIFHRTITVQHRLCYLT